MPKKLLTDKFVASVKPGKQAQVDYFDLGHPALALRVGHRDKVFTFHYRVGSVLKRRTLGRYPEMTLAEAREAWRLTRKALAEGTALHKPTALLCSTIRGLAARQAAKHGPSR